MTIYDSSHPVESLRRAVHTTVQRSPISGLNFLFAGRRPAVRLPTGPLRIALAEAAEQLLVASERVTDEDWHTVQQDVLLVLDPDDLDGPHAERLIGDELVADTRIRRIDAQAHLRGHARRGRRRARPRGRGGPLSRR